MGHLTQEQRYTIEALNNEKFSQTEIAKRIGKDKSVVCRELKRNSDKRNGEYRASLAHRRCKKRHSEKTKIIYFTEEVKVFVDKYIKEDFSPEQIVGFARKNGTNCVSTERIYQYIWDDKKNGGYLYTHLRTKGKTYRKRGAYKDKRGQIVGRKGIEERPKEVNEKQRLGDVEIDLIVGAGQSGYLLTVNDRATNLSKIEKLDTKEASVVGKAIYETLLEWKPILKTITSDNGKEFANHLEVSNKLATDYFFANPYHSWERGANENMNGLIRQYFPKAMRFDNINKEDVKYVEEKLNNRPRKKFGFQTPNEVFLQALNNNGRVAFIT